MAFMNAQNQPMWSTMLGTLGAAISPQDSWQRNLGSAVATLGQGQQYAQALNAQRGIMQPQQQPPQPQSLTVKFANPIGTPGSQMDAGIGGQPQPQVSNSMAPTAPIPQGTGMSQFNPMRQQQQSNMMQTALPQIMANGGQAASPFGVAQWLQSLSLWGK